MTEKKAGQTPPTDDMIMHGSPVGQPPEPEPEPQPPAETTITVKLGGKEYVVAPDVAEAIEGYRRELNERDGRRGSEIERIRREMDELRKSAAKPPETPKPDVPQPPNPLLVLQDPEAYQREMLAYVNLVNAQRDQALRDEYRTAEEQRREETDRAKAWERHVAKFYQTHPDLTGEEDLVDLVWRQHFDEIRDLPVMQGFERVADLTRERMLRYAGKAKEKSSTPQLEGSRTKQAAPPPPLKEEPVGSLSSAIRARQRRMRSMPEPAAK